MPNGKDNCIVFASHGLEFWACWILDVSVGQDRAMGNVDLGKYQKVFFLQQKFDGGDGSCGRQDLPPKGFGALRNGAAIGMEPNRPVPDNFKPFYGSFCFEVYVKQ